MYILWAVGGISRDLKSIPAVQVRFCHQMNSGQVQAFLSNARQGKHFLVLRDFSGYGPYGWRIVGLCPWLDPSPAHSCHISCHLVSQQSLLQCVLCLRVLFTPIHPLTELPPSSVIFLKHLQLSNPQRFSMQGWGLISFTRFTWPPMIASHLTALTISTASSPGRTQNMKKA